MLGFRPLIIFDLALENTLRGLKNQGHTFLCVPEALMWTGEDTGASVYAPTTVSPQITQNTFSVSHVVSATWITQWGNHMISENRVSFVIFWKSNTGLNTGFICRRPLFARYWDFSIRKNIITFGHCVFCLLDSSQPNKWSIFSYIQCPHICIRAVTLKPL